MLQRMFWKGCSEDGRLIVNLSYHVMRGRSIRIDRKVYQAHTEIKIIDYKWWGRSCVFHQCHAFQRNNKLDSKRFIIAQWYMREGMEWFTEWQQGSSCFVNLITVLYLTRRRSVVLWHSNCDNNKVSEIVAMFCCCCCCFYYYYCWMIVLVWRIIVLTVKWFVVESLFTA